MVCLSLLFASRNNPLKLQHMRLDSGQYRTRDTRDRIGTLHSPGTSRGCARMSQSTRTLPPWLPSSRVPPPRSAPACSLARWTPRRTGSCSPAPASPTSCPAPVPANTPAALRKAAEHCCVRQPILVQAHLRPVLSPCLLMAPPGAAVDLAVPSAVLGNDGSNTGGGKAEGRQIRPGLWPPFPSMPWLPSPTPGLIFRPSFFPSPWLWRPPGGTMGSGTSPQPHPAFGGVAGRPRP